MAGRPQNPVSWSYPELGQFCEDLRQLRADAGNPTLRVMADRGFVSPARLSVAVAGKVAPTWAVVKAWIHGCGQEADEHWRQRHSEMLASFQEAKSALAGGFRPPDTRAPVPELVFVPANSSAAAELSTAEEAPHLGIALTSGQDPTRAHYEAYKNDRAIMIHELRQLHRGHGVLAVDVMQRVGPQLMTILGINRQMPLGEARARLIGGLTATILDLPPELQMPLQAAFALPPADQSRFLRERLEWVGGRLERDPRTARRRVEEGMALLAELLQQPIRR